MIIKKKKKATKSVINRKFWTNTFHYLLNNKTNDTKLVVELFNAFPKINIVQEIWNLTEVNFIKTMRKMTLIKIGTNCKFFIYPEIFHSFFPNKKKNSKFSENIYLTKEKELDLDLGVLIDKNIFKDEKNKISIRLLFPSKIDVKNLVMSKLSRISILKKKNSGSKKFFFFGKKILKKNKSENSFLDKIEVSGGNNSFTSSRESSFLKKKEEKKEKSQNLKNQKKEYLNFSPKKSPKSPKTKKSPKSSKSKKSLNKNKTKTDPIYITPSDSKKFENIIIHIHGGGFISSSSSYHQRKIKRLFN